MIFAEHLFVFLSYSGVEPTNRPRIPTTRRDFFYSGFDSFNFFPYI